MKIWLDLELKQDIDDYITLLFAIETNKNITEISINNPSINELKLLKFIKEKFNLNIPIIYNGNIINVNDKDIHIVLLNLIKNIDLNLEKDVIYINKYLEKDLDFSNRIIFCGGSFTTLKTILEKYSNQTITSYLQGGYAGHSIVGDKNVLNKFKNREKVPSWNPNLDIKASDYIIESKNLKAYFISKNVCHNSWMNAEDFINPNSEIYKFLIEYFKVNKYSSKCMHDLVAFASIFNKTFIEFKKVDLFHNNDKLIAWYSILNEKSNKEISISLNMDKFKNYINSELLKN